MSELIDAIEKINIKDWKQEPDDYDENKKHTLYVIHALGESSSGGFVESYVKESGKRVVFLSSQKAEQYKNNLKDFRWTYTIYEINGNAFNKNNDIILK